MLLYIWVNKDFGQFVLFHQMIQFPMQILISLIIYRISSKFTSEGNAFLSAVVYSLCPLVVFTWLSRYDVIPTFLTLVSILLLLRERYSSSFLLLGIATMIKWYPATLLLTYAVYLARNKTPLKSIIEYFTVFFIICLIPTFPFFSKKLLQWIIDTLTPFAHYYRSQNKESLSGFVAFVLYQDFRQEGFFSTLFRLLLVSGPLLPLILLPKKREEVVGSCTIVILALLTFSKFYSIQWIAWVTPLLLVMIRNRVDWLKFWALQFVAYLQYPVLSDYGELCMWNWPLNDMRHVFSFSYWFLVGMKFLLYLSLSVTIAQRVRPVDQT